MWAWKHPHDATAPPPTHKLEGDITFTDVDFGYEPEKTVLHDINLYGRPGQKIAFVGSTGAGKTTITNLINRFYDIQDGKIRTTASTSSPDQKGRSAPLSGHRLQDTHLFTGTVMENIRYGRLDATDEECMAAATARKRGRLHPPPAGRLQHDADRRRREPVAGPAPAAGDCPRGRRRPAGADPGRGNCPPSTPAPRHRAGGMDGLMYGRTTFVIAHRLSTVRNADCIMVLEQGRIIERGTHDELIAKKGNFSSLSPGNRPNT